MADDKEQPTLSVELDWAHEPPALFANGAQVLGTPREFAILFTDFLGIEGRGDTARGTTPKAKIVSHLRMSPDAFFELASAVASNWNTFVSLHADPNAPAPKFRLVGGGDMQLEGLEPPRSSE